MKRVALVACVLWSACVISVPKPSPAPAPAPVVVPAPVVPSTPPIHAEGVWFKQPDGSRWVWGMATEFLLIGRVQNGEDISAIWQNLDDAGLNGVRVLTMASYIANYAPSDATLTALDALLVDAEHHGKYVEVTVFADAQIVMPDVNAQKAWLARVAEALNRHPNAFGELCNECGKNGVDPQQFSKPAGPTLWSRGSDLSDEPPPVPAWDYSTIHTRRDDPKWQLAGQDTFWASRGWAEGSAGFPGTHGPVVLDEPMGADESDQPGKRSTDAGAFKRLATDAAMWGAGATFHSTSGITAQPFGPVQAGCAKAFGDGLKAGY